MIKQSKNRFYGALLASIVFHSLLLFFFDSGGISGNIQLISPGQSIPISIKLIQNNSLNKLEVTPEIFLNPLGSSAQDVITISEADTDVVSIKESSQIEKPQENNIDSEKIKPTYEETINSREEIKNEELNIESKNTNENLTNNPIENTLINSNPNPSSLEQGIIGENGLSPIGIRQVKMSEQMGELSYILYFDDWKSKVEKFGILNYPVNADTMFSSLVLSVIIKSDGTIQSMEIIRSSGIPSVDEDAKNIVISSAPFAPFPPDIQKNVDTIEILKTWTFK